jgi:hypothetical protein
MGWNDSRFVDALSIKKSLALFLGAVLIFGIAFTKNTSAQSDNEDKKEVITYKVDFWIPPTIRNHYSYKETTDVTRTYSDGTVMNFAREVTYFFDLKAPNPKSDGFIDLNISLDSMHYSFTKGDYSYSFNSQGDMPGNFGLHDYTANAVALGRFYTLTYSPYGNISKLEGEELEEFRESIVRKKEHFKSMDYYLWTVGANDPRLIHISDIKKIYYPGFRISEDSTFQTPLYLQLNHIDMQDTVEMTLNEVSGGTMYFSGNIEDAEYFTKQARFEGIPDQLVDIDNVKAQGTISTELTPRGTPEKTEIDIIMEVEAKVKREVFTEVVKSKMTWQLLGQWEY